MPAWLDLGLSLSLLLTVAVRPWFVFVLDCEGGSSVLSSRAYVLFLILEVILGREIHVPFYSSLFLQVCNSDEKVLFFHSDP